MTQEKFIEEVQTLKNFFEIYCDDKHSNQTMQNYTLSYKEKTHLVNITLCSQCSQLLEYSFSRLQNCPFEQKPKCRKCLHPCYDKAQWKAVAKIMKHSGMKLGLLKIKRLIKGNTNALSSIF